MSKKYSGLEMTDDHLENVNGGDICAIYNGGILSHYVVSQKRCDKNGNFRCLAFVGKYNSYQQASDAVDQYNLEHPDKPITKDYFDSRDWDLPENLKK